ncbi:hypothetical protein CJF42_08740 [Pseudoalteromonas sp. NBT06-2]|uniref:glycosyltransferase n=1 Tax=Pseudoalteromonas sp. NBT06-2 TaxID=2025950 RepID=UPI000BA7B052|nr:glycosyltransferase family A protein [Pseudoalteromonas sp. NBT06-2]PAJ74758.1 hypothetical protein CJF42_08740 [Pseudoalteromonas sp. NBT06-2]
MVNYNKKEDNVIVDESIGIVVIGRNEGERLKRCLKSALKAQYPIVYVDSDSVDGSVLFAQSNDILVVKLTKDQPLNAAVARNAGFKKLIAENVNIEFVHFIDADCELAENWIIQAVRKLDSNDEVSAVCGRLREKNVNESLYTKLCDMSWYIKPGEVNSCGGIATIKAEIFEKLNGFNETLIAGEEPEFYSRVRKKGYKVQCLDVFMGTHDCAMTSFGQWWTRTIKTGFGFANAQKWGAWQARQRSIIIWALIIPLAILIGSFIEFYFILFCLIYPTQIFRMTLKSKIPYCFSDKLLNSSFCVFSKLPQLIGMIKYHFSRLNGKQNINIEYKA